jgi:hypothetical protein
LSKQFVIRNDVNKALDILLALDRVVMEFSMNAYNIPRRERRVLRKQNQRLHRAVRKHLPRLVQSRAPSQAHS